MNPNMNETTMPQLIAILVLFTLFAASPAAAKKSDFRQPLDVKADRSEFDEQQGVQTLIGNVEITQGTMKILADRIAIHLRDNKLSSIQGVGSPIHFEQQNEAGELITGEAREINYDAVRGSLVLAGNATLSQPRQELVSERIVFDSRTQKVIAEGGDNGRVSIRIQPPTPDASGN